MQERETLMRQLRDHLAELFALCGCPDRKAAVMPAPTPLRWLEALWKDRGLCGYLEELDRQTEQAIGAVKERNLELWNAQQNELLLEQKERELEQLRRALEERSAPPAQEDPLPELLQGLVEMRDHLLMRRRWIRDVAPEEEAAAKLVEGQLQESARLLERAGVELLDQGGAFDSGIHTVVETKAAPTPEQADQIAETFRPGYRYRGKVLRPQEVILYTGGSEVEKCH